MTYDLYVVAYPRLANEIVSEKLIITLQDRDSSSASDYYTMTLDKFNVAIKAGYRYWFNLTACKDKETGERKLMFTREWEDAQSAQKPDNGE